eukprot:15453851-Alexandrium_andersonii.AAC.1
MRPLGTSTQIGVSEFVAMIALNQGDEGRGGKIRFLFGALVARPKEGDPDDPRTLPSALKRCVSVNW